MNPLAITGLGVVSPVASGFDALQKALANPTRAASDAFGAPSVFDAGHYPGAWVADVRGFDPTPILGDKGLRNLDRLTKLFLVAARGVLEHSGIKRVYGGERIGVCASTAYGSLEAMTELNRVAVLENPRYLNPSRFPNTVINSALGYVSIWDDLRALNATVCNGNCGALDAVLCAETYLASGRADAILVGGAEAMHEGLFLAFHRLESLARRDQHYAPGSARSDGMRVGGGGRARDAGTRRCRAQAWRSGAGAHRRVRHIVRAARERSALDSHRARPDCAGHRVCVARRRRPPRPGRRGRQLGERHLRASMLPKLETIRSTLGEGACVAAPKSVFGETLGASGAFGMAAATAWLNGTPVSLVIHGKAPDQARCVLVTTVGFYGNASAVVLRAAA